MLVESLHSPNPVFAPGQLPANATARVVTRTCLTHASLEPVRMHVVESSGLASVDALVLGTLHGWRIRTRPGWTFERPICVLNIFVIRQQ